MGVGEQSVFLTDYRAKGLQVLHGTKNGCSGCTEINEVARKEVVDRMECLKPRFSKC